MMVEDRGCKRCCPRGCIEIFLFFMSVSADELLCSGSRSGTRSSSEAGTGREDRGCKSREQKSSAHYVNYMCIHS